MIPIDFCCAAGTRAQDINAQLEAICSQYEVVDIDAVMVDGCPLITLMVPRDEEEQTELREEEGLDTEDDGEDGEGIKPSLCATLVLMDLSTKIAAEKTAAILEKRVEQINERGGNIVDVKNISGQRVEPTTNPELMRVINRNWRIYIWEIESDGNSYYGEDDQDDEQEQDEETTPADSSHPDDDTVGEGKSTKKPDQDDEEDGTAD